MIIVWVTVSILVIAFLARLLSLISPIKICPICAGVAGTWVILLVLKYLGQPIDPIILAILLGGSVVGMAFQLEKKISSQALLFKTLFIPTGFIAAYAVIFERFILLGIALALLLIFALVFIFRTKTSQNNKSETAGGKAEEIKRQLKNCC